MMIQDTLSLLQKSFLPFTHSLNDYFDALDTQANTISLQCGKYLHTTQMSPSIISLIETTTRSLHYIAMRVLLPAPIALACSTILATHPQNFEHIKQRTTHIINGFTLGGFVCIVKNLICLDLVGCAIEALATGILIPASSFTKE